MAEEQAKNSTSSAEAPQGAPATQGEPAQPETLSDAAALEADLRKLQEERDALFEQVARVQADFRNAQRRLEAEKQQAIQFANTALIQSLIPVIDGFERALAVDPAAADAASILSGVRMVYEHLLTVLKQQHVEIIAPEKGSAFDPNVHQAVTRRADPSFTAPVVAELLQKGYRVFGRLIRPAAVVVGVPPASEES